MKFYYLFSKILSDTYKGFVDEKKEKERQLIEEKYNTKEWENVMNHIYRRNMHYNRKSLITQNAFKLACKIQQDIDREVFPVIVQQYLGSMHNDEGYWLWRMYTKDLREVGSSLATKTLLPKKVKIVEMDEDTYLYIDIMSKEES